MNAHWNRSRPRLRLKGTGRIFLLGARIGELGVGWLFCGRPRRFCSSVALISGSPPGRAVCPVSGRLLRSAGTAQCALRGPGVMGHRRTPSSPMAAGLGAR